MLLDVPFPAEKGSVAIAKLKTRKAAGPDGLTIEHLKAGGKQLLAIEHIPLGKPITSISLC